MSKYKNKPIVIDGHRFPSTKEGMRYKELKELQDDGIITELKLQQRFTLVPTQMVPHPYIDIETGRMVYKLYPITYVADFTYRNAKGEFVCEDVKGYKTEVYKMKKKLMLEKYGIQISEV